MSKVMNKKELNNSMQDLNNMINSLSNINLNKSSMLVVLKNILNSYSDIELTNVELIVNNELFDLTNICIFTNTIELVGVNK